MGITRLTLDLGILGEQECTVKYDYQPYERADQYYPGCPEGVDIYSILWNNVDIIDDIPRDTLSDLNIQLLEQINYNEVD